jgi:TP901 family phage tail tape measure protein
MPLSAESKKAEESINRIAETTSNVDMVITNAFQGMADAVADFALGGKASFGDMVNALSDAGSAKEMDVVEMFKRAGAAAKASGVDQKTALAYLTAMNNVGMDPEVAARGFQSIAGSMAQATEQGDKFQEGLKMLGLNAKKLEKDMKTNAPKALVDVFDRLEKSANKGKIAIKLAGKEWWDEMLRIGQAGDEVKKNMEIVRDPKRWKGSMDKSLNIQLATTANHLERLKALASEVGDRLGQWALPPINAAIERVIAGLNELDSRSGRKAGDAAAVDDAAGKLASGTQLTPEQRRRMATDAQFDEAVSVEARRRKDAAEEEKGATLRRAVERDRQEDGMEGMQASRRREIERLRLDREIKDLGDSLIMRDPSGRSGSFLAERRKLESLRGQRTALGAPENPATGSTFSRSDTDEMRARLPHSKEASRLAEIERLRTRISTIERLAEQQQNPRDREGFQKDAGSFRRQLWRTVAPNAEDANRFGFGIGGAKPTKDKPSIGYGQRFGIGGDGGVGMKKMLDVDIGDAGLTIAEKRAQGLKAGQGQTDGAAQQIGEGVKQKLSSVEAASAGQKVVADYAAGITAGGGAAVAAAEAVAAFV